MGRSGMDSSPMVWASWRMGRLVVMKSKWTVLGMEKGTAGLVGGMTRFQRTSLTSCSSLIRSGTSAWCTSTATMRSPRMCRCSPRRASSSVWVACSTAGKPSPTPTCRTGCWRTHAMLPSICTAMLPSLSNFSCILKMLGSC
uniref:Uncharacterized protein n=1 Tax=Cacopsylla melanoneura TaxID=428564 RepID=A0A8D8YXW8_9HEMI